ncbi:MAG: PAS domain-containing protein [Flavisolibacter sp.]
MSKIQGNTKEIKSFDSNKSKALSDDEMLYHRAFDMSLQANIIFTVSTGQIELANQAACKLLGYSKTELLTIGRGAIFVNDESSFKELQKEENAEWKFPGLTTAIKKNGKQFPCEVTSAVFVDEEGVKRAITTIVDKSQSILKQKNIDARKEKIVAGNILLAKSRQRKIDAKKEKAVADNIKMALTKSDDRIAKNNEWIKCIAKTSYDVMWDLNIASGKIYVGDSIEEVFGYKVPNNTATFTDFSKCLLPGEKEVVESLLSKTLASDSKSWNDSYSFKRQDGSVADTNSRASIVRDDHGKAIRLIGAIRDISRLQELEKQLEKQIAIQLEDNEKFLLTAKLSFDIIWDWNVKTDDVFIGEGFEELFGFPVKDNKITVADFINFVHPDDKEVVQKGLKDAIASSVSYWGQDFRLIRADGSVANVFDRASIIRHPDGKAYRMIGALQDISRQKELEERLEREIISKERELAAAAEKGKETARLDIGKELHDNVNQLLWASRQYLDLAKRGGKDSEMYLSRASENTLSAIEEIRKLAKGQSTDTIKAFGLCTAIEHILQGSLELSAIKVSCKFERFKEDSVNSKFKLNLFRIVQEQITNIIKHAKATEVAIGLLQNKKFIVLSISDNGVGFHTGKSQNGVGIINIKSRAEEYKGWADFITEPGKGCVLTVTFPVGYALLNKRSGLTLTDEKKNKLVEKIKNVIADLIHYADAQLEINISKYLSSKLHYDYTYLANVFSTVEGIPIEKFIILQKIERVKSLLIYDELNLTQIALKLHYSSVAHLSSQFKKVTGQTPSFFRKMQHRRLNAQEDL